MSIEPINVKVSIIGDNFCFSFEEDYTEYAHDLIECENVFSNSGETMTEDNIMNYFKEGTFSDEDIEKLNGSHFLFGFMEALGQSERCPDTLYSYTGNLTYKTELIRE